MKNSTTNKIMAGALSVLMCLFQMPGIPQAVYADPIGLMNEADRIEPGGVSPDSVVVEESPAVPPGSVQEGPALSKGGELQDKTASDAPARVIQVTARISPTQTITIEVTDFVCIKAPCNQKASFSWKGENYVIELGDNGDGILKGTGVGATSGARVTIGLKGSADQQTLALVSLDETVFRKSDTVSKTIETNYAFDQGRLISKKEVIYRIERQNSNGDHRYLLTVTKKRWTLTWDTKKNTVKNKTLAGSLTEEFRILAGKNDLIYIEKKENGRWLRILKPQLDPERHEASVWLSGKEFHLFRVPQGKLVMRAVAFKAETRGVFFEGTEAKIGEDSRIVVFEDGTAIVEYNGVIYGQDGALRYDPATQSVRIAISSSHVLLIYFQGSRLKATEHIEGEGPFATHYRRYYDEKGRMVACDYEYPGPERRIHGSFQYFYNDRGQLVAAEGDSEWFTVRSDGSEVRVWIQHISFSVSYDEAGNIVRMSWIKDTDYADGRTSHSEEIKEYRYERINGKWKKISESRDYRDGNNIAGYVEFWIHDAQGEQIGHLRITRLGKRTRVFGEIPTAEVDGDGNPVVRSIAGWIDGDAIPLMGRTWQEAVRQLDGILVESEGKNYLVRVDDNGRVTLEPPVFALLVQRAFGQPLASARPIIFDTPVEVFKNGAVRITWLGKVYEAWMDWQTSTARGGGLTLVFEGQALVEVRQENKIYRFNDGGLWTEYHNSSESAKTDSFYEYSRIGGNWYLTRISHDFAMNAYGWRYSRNIHTATYDEDARLISLRHESQARLQLGAAPYQIQISETVYIDGLGKNILSYIYSHPDPNAQPTARLLLFSYDEQGNRTGQTEIKQIPYKGVVEINGKGYAVEIRNDGELILKELPPQVYDFAKYLQDNLPNMEIVVEEVIDPITHGVAYRVSINGCPAGPCTNLLGGFGSMSFGLTAEGKVIPDSFSVFYKGMEDEKINGQLLYEGVLGHLCPTNSQACADVYYPPEQAIADMTRVIIAAVDPDGAIHFRLGRLSYKVYRTAEMKLVIEVEPPPVPEGWTRAESNENFAYTVVESRIQRGGSTFLQRNLLVQDLRTGKIDTFYSTEFPDSYQAVDVSSDGKLAYAVIRNDYMGGGLIVGHFGADDTKKIDGNVEKVRFDRNGDIELISVAVTYRNGTKIGLSMIIDAETLDTVMRDGYLLLEQADAVLENGYLVIPTVNTYSNTYEVFFYDAKNGTENLHLLSVKIFHHACQSAGGCSGSGAYTLNADDIVYTTPGGRTVVSIGISAHGNQDADYSITYVIDPATGEQLTLGGAATAVEYDGQYAGYTIGGDEIWVDLSTLSQVEPKKSLQLRLLGILDGVIATIENAIAGFRQEIDRIGIAAEEIRGLKDGELREIADLLHLYKSEPAVQDLLEQLMSLLEDVGTYLDQSEVIIQNLQESILQSEKDLAMFRAFRVEIEAASSYSELKKLEAEMPVLMSKEKIYTFLPGDLQLRIEQMINEARLLIQEQAVREMVILDLVWSFGMNETWLRNAFRTGKAELVIDLKGHVADVLFHEAAPIDMTANLAHLLGPTVTPSKLRYFFEGDKKAVPLGGEFAPSGFQIYHAEFEIEDAIGSADYIEGVLRGVDIVFARETGIQHRTIVYQTVSPDKMIANIVTSYWTPERGSYRVTSTAEIELGHLRVLRETSDADVNLARDIFLDYKQVNIVCIPEATACSPGIQWVLERVRIIRFSDGKEISVDHIEQDFLGASRGFVISENEEPWEITFLGVDDLLRQIDEKTLPKERQEILNSIQHYASGEYCEGREYMCGSYLMEQMEAELQGIHEELSERWSEEVAQRANELMAELERLATEVGPIDLETTVRGWLSRASMTHAEFDAIKLQDGYSFRMMQDMTYEEFLAGEAYAQSFVPSIVAALEAGTAEDRERFLGLMSHVRHLVFLPNIYTPEPEGWITPSFANGDTGTVVTSFSFDVAQWASIGVPEEALPFYFLGLLAHEIKHLQDMVERPDLFDGNHWAEAEYRAWSEDYHFMKNYLKSHLPLFYNVRGFIDVHGPDQDYEGPVGRIFLLHELETGQEIFNQAVAPLMTAIDYLKDALDLTEEQIPYYVSSAVQSRPNPEGGADIEGYDFVFEVDGQERSVFVDLAGGMVFYNGQWILRGTVAV
ncbi:MAG: hypothetical protein ACOY3K_00390 [Candidatus Omnitrophota bacterium]